MIVAEGIEIEKGHGAHGPKMMIRPRWNERDPRENRRRWCRHQTQLEGLIQGHGNGGHGILVGRQIQRRTDKSGPGPRQGDPRPYSRFLKAPFGHVG